MGHVVSAFVYYAVLIADEVVDAWSGRVAGTEEKYVDEDDGLVVEKVTEGNLDEIKGYRGQLGDAADVRDAIDVGNDLLQGEVPRWIDNIHELDLGDGDVPCFDSRGSAVMRKELDVDSVGIV